MVGVEVSPTWRMSKGGLHFSLHSLTATYKQVRYQHASYFNIIRLDGCSSKCAVEAGKTNSLLCVIATYKRKISDTSLENAEKTSKMVVNHVGQVED